MEVYLHVYIFSPLFSVADDFILFVCLFVVVVVVECQISKDPGLVCFVCSNCTDTSIVFAQIFAAVAHW